MNKQKALELRKSGKTYKEIGEILGASRQAVFQAIGKVRRRQSLYTDIPYVWLYKYFRKNEQITYRSFCAKKLNKDDNKFVERFRKFLTGSDIKFSITQFDKIADACGMTIDECFRRRK